MGQSTDALLFYGYCWDEEEEIDGASPPWKGEDEEDDRDEDDFIVAKLGLPHPAVAYSEEAKPVYHEFWEKKSALLASVPCEIIRHCSGECRMYGVAVKTSSKTASRGNPEALTDFTVKPEWDAQLAAYLELLGIKTEQKPTWWLASDWN